jgi:GNAT superfamily N-acetyltransferase
MTTALATAGRVWEMGPLRWTWHPHARELLLLFPEAVPADALAHGLARGAGLGACIAGCWGGPDTDEAPLLAAGFERGWRPHWMTARRASLPAAAPDQRVAITGDVPEFDDYGRALLTLASEPHAWHAVARVDGVYAGHAWAFTAAGVTGLYDLDVRPPFRRRGLGRALTLAVLDAAGADRVTLNATPEGERLYGALGFESLGHGRTWWRHAGTAGPREV